MILMGKLQLKGPLDIGISGFDRSGTSTQINGIIDHLEKQYGLQVKDFRGSENAALFHADQFRDKIGNHISWKGFLLDNSIPSSVKMELSYEFAKLMEGVSTINGPDGEPVNKKAGADLKIGAFADDDEYFTRLSLENLDVAIFEEPAKRTSGVSCRKVEQKMSAFDRDLTPRETLLAHSIYRKDEFLRFRERLRMHNKIIVRSRTEESTMAYQFMDKNVLPKGTTLEEFMDAPGITEYALKYPPTHLFIVCGPEDMTKDDLKSIYNARNDGRVEDDFEKNLDYQLLVNNRYASGEVELLYEKLCPELGARKPEFIYLNLYDDIETMNSKITGELDRIIKEYRTAV
ncbi:MAG: hypothetical protein ACLFTH_00450 [Candidatus Woesearchaeota archaeon]